MKVLCVLLAAAIIQGSAGQQDIFSVEPQAPNVVSEGDEVTLECITREPATCGWRLKLSSETDETSFLNIQQNLVEKLGLRVRDPVAATTDCTIIIDVVERRHSGTYTCAPFVGGGQTLGTPAEVVVAVKPTSVAFTGDQANVSELQASSRDPVSVTCEASDARPPAQLRWFLDDRELTDGAVPEEVTDPSSGLVTSQSTLTHQFESRDEGAVLRCQATHVAYEDLDERDATLPVVVKFAPTRAEGADLGTLYGFTEGETRDVTVNFTANPAPYEILWTVGSETLADSSEADNGRILTGPLETVDGAAHQYSVRLTISPVKTEDQNTTVTLQLTNDVDRASFSMRLGADAPPPSATAAPPAAAEGGVSGGAIGGIIVAVIVLLTLIALIAFARSRGKWCFAAKPSDAGAEASDTESSHDEKPAKPEGKGFKLSTLYSSLVTKKKEGDVESAASKDETKELTAPDGEGSPKREQPEVVYAELVLDKDGVKTEVRPSPEKTEYAVIVGTKTPEAKE